MSEYTACYPIVLKMLRVSDDLDLLRNMIADYNSGVESRVEIAKNTALAVLTSLHWHGHVEHGKKQLYCIPDLPKEFRVSPEGQVLKHMFHCGVPTDEALAADDWNSGPIIPISCDSIRGVSLLNDYGLWIEGCISIVNRHPSLLTPRQSFVEPLIPAIENPRSRIRAIGTRQHPSHVFRQFFG